MASEKTEVTIESKENSNVQSTNNYEEVDNDSTSSSAGINSMNTWRFGYLKVTGKFMKFILVALIYLIITCVACYNITKERRVDLWGYFLSFVIGACTKSPDFSLGKKDRK